MVKNLKQELLLLTTRARFILDVINDIVKVRNIPKSEIISTLETLKYPKMLPNIGILELININPKQKDEGTYDFLISMPIYSLTKEKVDELLKEKEQKKTELEILESKSAKDLWEEDLVLFEGEYKKHIDEYCDYMSINSKEFNYNKSSKSEQKKIALKSK